MTRKTLCFITMLMACISVWAEVTGNDWYKYPIYCDKIDDVVETSTKVYYLSGGNLFSFSPADNESFAYSHLNELNGQNIQDLYYNNQKKYLLVVYEDSNLDVILDDGQVINMPDIRDASMTQSKHINDVAFGENRIVIATDFGIVIYNDDRFEVMESGVYNNVINSVGIMNGHLLIYGHYATNFTLMYSPLDTRHNTLDKFKPMFRWAMSDFCVLGDDLLAFRENSNKGIYLRRFDFQTGKLTPVANELHAYNYPFKTYKDGYYTRTADKILLLEGENVSEYSIPESLREQKMSFYESPSKIWVGDVDGVSCIDISTTPPTVLFDKMLYSDYITDTRVGYMKWSQDGQRLYISNLEASIWRSFAHGEGSTNYQTTNIIEPTRVTDASLKNASGDHEYSLRYKDRFGSTRMFGDPMAVVEDPDDPDRYYCATNFEGIYVIKRNPQTGEYEELGRFTPENSTIEDSWGSRTFYVDIDQEGNLWVGHQHGCIVSILPADKRRQDPKTITKADWVAHTKLDGLNYSGRDFVGVICRQSNMVFYAMSCYEGGFVALDTKGTYTDPSDDVAHVWPRLLDQDGKELNYSYITFFLEDNRGCVWVGTTQGIFEITKPSDATDPTMRVRRIKVPRNDGTNYADYLLDSDMILWMALDPSNRKWVATESSGIYLVSETGDKIIYHFDSTNSPLTNNLVTSIECDRHDNTVYVGTCYGLFTFKGDSSPGQADYSEIYAYPNPVRPEYSGMVTITGLMDHSVVKITDSMGNVVYETRSEGGMATWDVCNRSGDRVRSGVYYVYASRSNDNTSTGAVTKILVIN